MKRLVLFSFVLLALVLFVTSCFKPPFVVITLSSDAQSKNVIEGTEITFSGLSKLRMNSVRSSTL